ncbi:GGDEF domain-containing protein [Frisingicoccus sp.]|uniref:GGDEF domain-containing protein n=1 Tax=Frisingicoccus sp. TaxID=1918627 RepID=UPI002E77B4A1|nr:GGDEF domain-containing protein [Frisingicoccus sp.]
MTGGITIRRHVSRGICVFLVIVIAAALIKSFMIDNGSGRVPLGEITELNQQWVKEIKKNAEGTCWEYVYRIPEGLGENLVFSMENSWAALEVFLDGQEMYAFEDIYREHGNRRHWVELPGDSSGKELSVRITESKKFVDRIMKKPIYLGEKNAIFYRSLSSGFYALIFFFLTLISILVSFFYRISFRADMSKKSLRRMQFLDLFILDVGIWVLTDSQIMQLFTGRTSIVSLVSFVTFLLMPLFIILFVKEMMVYRWKVFDILLGIGSVNTAVILGVYLFRMAPIYQWLFLQHVFIVITIIIILEKSIIEIKKYKNQGIKKVVIGFALLSLCGIVSLILFYSKSPVNYVYFYCLGFFVFMGCLIWAVFDEVYYYVEESAKAKIYRKMIYIDVMTGMENRTAFEKMLEDDISAEGIAYIVFDNDNLKVINDNCGHQAGDLLLRETAKCIRKVFGKFGRCFRIGGDEFLVMLREMTEDGIKESLDYFDREVDKINKEGKTHIEISYGYFFCEDASMTLNELFEKADANMYLKKRRVKGERRTTYSESSPESDLKKSLE